MTLATTSRKIQHNGNGTLTTFSYNFRVDEVDHVEVYITDVNGTDYLQSDYTVSGTLGDPLGGYIIFGDDSIPASNERVTIVREVPYTQTTDLVEGGLFRAETVEAQFDSTVMQVQQLAEADDRTLKGPISDVAPNMILPTSADRKGKFLYFDATTGDVDVAEGQTIISSHNHDGRYLSLLGSDATNQTVSGSITTTRDVSARHLNASGNIKQAGTQVSLDGHTHDGRYYTETELNAGQLDNRYYTETELNAGQLDNRYYTETEVDILDAELDTKIDTTSGTLQDQINLSVDHGSLTGLSDDDHTQYLLRTDFTTYSGSMVSDWIAADTVIDAKIDTTSGTLQGQIDGLTIDHGELTGLGDDDHLQYMLRTDFTTYSGAIINQIPTDFYTTSEVDTISGVLSAEIDSDISTHGSNANAHHNQNHDNTDHSTNYLADIVDDTSPQLGGNLELNGKCIDYGGILTVNGTYKGDIMTVTVDDGSTVFGNVLYQAADFHYERADANTSSTSPAFVIALESGSGSKEVLLRGQICNTAWNWSAGKIYLSGTTGSMTQTVVSGSGDQIQVLGWTLSADTIFFDPVTMVAEVL